MRGRLICWLFRVKRTARKDSYNRLLAYWCDYQPAHRGQQFTAMVNDRPWG